MEKRTQCIFDQFPMKKSQKIWNSCFFAKMPLRKNVFMFFAFYCIRIYEESSYNIHVAKHTLLALSYFLLGSAGSGQLPAGIPAKTVAIFAGPAGPGRAGPEVWGRFGEVFRKRFRAASGAPRRRPGRGKNNAKKR